MISFLRRNKYIFMFNITTFDRNLNIIFHTSTKYSNFSTMPFTSIYNMF